MMKVFIVDDDAAVLEVVKEAIEAGIPNAECITEMDFAAAEQRLVDFRPDAIVLDLMLDEGVSGLSGVSGQGTWRNVWNQQFCPIIIYTAWDGDLEPDVPDDHPYVTRVAKGSGTEGAVVAELERFAPAIEAINSLQQEVKSVVHQVLRETAGSGALPVDDPDQLLHLGRRRVAASMDDPKSVGNREMKCWEQYLVPPIGDSLVTGDLLKERAADPGDPASYRLVLTPSCDMVKGRNEETILTARCHQTSVLINKMSLSTNPTKATKNFKSGALTPGCRDGYFPLPPIPDRMPGMVAYLKDLEVLKFDLIEPEDSQAAGFDRIASIDSPFREQVSWAFLSTVARPGMPDRDLESWAKQCVQDAATS